MGGAGGEAEVAWLFEPYESGNLAVSEKETPLETAKLTVRLPRKDLEFAKRYAQEHRMTVTELIDRYLQRLQGGQTGPIHPEVEKISGLVPSDVDAERLYHEHIMSKHR
jgi:hypothetical protein